MLLAVSLDGFVYALAKDDTIWRRYPDVAIDLQVKCISAVPGFIYALGENNVVYVSVTKSKNVIKFREEVAPKQVPLENVKLPSSAWEWEGEWSSVTPESEDSPVSLSLRKYRYRVYTAVDRWVPLTCSPSNVLMYGEFFTSITTGGHALQSKEHCHHSHFLWAVSNLGKLYWRVGIGADSPEGVEWMNLPTPEVAKDICCGPNGSIFIVTQSKKLFIRLGVQPHCPIGTHWVELNQPMTPVKSVRLTYLCVWAFDENGDPWLAERPATDLKSCTTDLMHVEWSKVNFKIAGLSQNEYHLVFSLGTDGSIYYYKSRTTNEPEDNWLPVNAEFEDKSLVMFWKQVEAGSLMTSTVPIWVTFELYSSGLFSFPGSKHFEPSYFKLELMGQPAIRTNLLVYSHDKSTLKWETSFGKMVDVAPISKSNDYQVAIYVIKDLNTIPPPHILQFESRDTFTQWFMRIYSASQNCHHYNNSNDDDKSTALQQAGENMDPDMVDNLVLVQDCKGMSLPIFYHLKYGFQKGASVTVSGSVSSFSSRFEINFDCGSRLNIALHFNPRQDEDVIVRNSGYNGNWAAEERRGKNLVWQEPDKKWQFHFICEESRFKIYVNRVFFCYFSHRTPPEKITTLRISGNTVVHRILYDTNTNDFVLSEDNGLQCIELQSEPTPWCYSLSSGFSSGHKLILYGYSPRNSQRFSVQLLVNPNSIPLDVTYYFNDQVSTFKYIASGYVHRYMYSIPCKVNRNTHWHMIIICDKHRFKVYLNYHYLGCFENFMSNLQITEICVNGDAQINKVKYGVLKSKE